MKKNTEFLNGVKGMAAIMVVLHHFLLAFLPATYYGDSTISRIPFQLDVKFAQSIFSFLFNGNFMVHIFLMVSALIYTNKILNTDRAELSTVVSNVLIKRYLRLIVPIFVVSLIIYLLNGLNLFSNISVGNITKSSWLMSYYNDKLSFMDIINGVLFLIPFVGNNVICSVFWCIPYLIFGCYLSILLGIYIKKIERKSIYLLLILILFCVLNSSYYLSILLGILLSFGIKFKIFSTKKNIKKGIIFIFVGCFLGAYPSGTVPTNIYKYLNFIFLTDPKVIMHGFGAFFLLYGILKIENIRKCFLNKYCILASKYSFSMYLVHIPILYTIGTSTFKLLYLNVLKKYLFSVFITLIIFSIFLYIFSVLFNKIIEIKLYKFLLNQYFKIIKED